MIRGVLIALGCLCASTALAAPGVEEIVQKTNEVAYYQGLDGRAKVTLTIADSQGRTRTRVFAMIRRDKPNTSGDQSYYLYFQSPPDVAKTAYLVHKKVGRDDDRWLYIPSLDLVRRIAASDKRTSFVGSDFVYEDVSGRDLQEDRHTLKETTKSYYVLEHTPKKPDDAEFSRYLMYVHKKSFLPTKIEFFDKANKKARIYTVLKVGKIQGHTTVRKAKMEDLKTGGHTIAEYDSITYDLRVPQRIFSERYLRRPPVKYLP